MNGQLELWHLVLLALSILGGYWTLTKIIAGQFQRGLDHRFAVLDEAAKLQYQQLNRRLDGLDSAAKADVGQWQRVERELLVLKADLSRDYVRRDDFVQAIGGISTRIDNFALRMERALDNRKGEHL